jgi:hypothetical protein
MFPKESKKTLPTTSLNSLNPEAMTERKLTPEEIGNLFELCEFHNVHHYDVQIELVDHLASAIEELWETNSEISFEEAVFQVCEQFGVDPIFHTEYQSLLPSISGKHLNGESGFEAIKEAKEKELHRKYDRLQLKYIGEFFQLPKIILTLFLTFSLFLIFKLSNNDRLVIYCIQGFYSLSLAIYLIFIYPKKFRLNIRSGKSFLLYDHFKNIRRAAIGVGFSFFNIIPIVIKVNRFKFGTSFSNYFNLELLAAFMIVLFGITTVAMCSYTPQRVKEDFTREFPQFVLS